MDADTPMAGLPNSEHEIDKVNDSETQSLKNEVHSLTTKLGPVNAHAGKQNNIANSGLSAEEVATAGAAQAKTALSPSLVRHHPNEDIAYLDLYEWYIEKNWID
ncbi:hypothetical protein N0V88_005044 [Collariella sp. IMI 366227]|nr:hypothetical protein N0V88_005044 [Collariella sp. IMI 366227]